MNDAAPNTHIRDVHFIKPGCSGCKSGAAAPLELAFAFQPIVDVPAGRVYAHEALVRGPKGRIGGVGACAN